MTLIRSEPRTAATAVAITLSVSTLGRSAGSPPLPPGVFQPLLPIVLVIVRFGWEPLGRILGAALLLTAAASGGLDLDSGHMMGDVDTAVASPVLALVGATLAAFVLVALCASVAAVDAAPAAPSTPAPADANSRWVAFARMLFKRLAGLRAREARPGRA